MFQPANNNNNKEKEEEEEGEETWETWRQNNGSWGVTNNNNINWNWGVNNDDWSGSEEEEGEGEEKKEDDDKNDDDDDADEKDDQKTKDGEKKKKKKEENDEKDGKDDEKKKKKKKKKKRRRRRPNNFINRGGRGGFMFGNGGFHMGRRTTHDGRNIMMNNITSVSGKVLVDEKFVDNVLIKKAIKQHKLTNKNIPEIQREIKNQQAIIDNFNENLEKDLKLYVKACDEKRESFVKMIKNNVKIMKERISAFEEIQKKKNKDEFKIKKETHFTPLLTKCYDVFELIFSYLDTQTIFLKILRVCSFFNNVITHKMVHKIEISWVKFSDYPIHEILSGFKIDTFTVKNNSGHFIGTDQDFKKLNMIINSNCAQLMKLNLSTMTCMITNRGGWNNNNTRKKGEKSRELEFVETLCKCKYLEYLEVPLFQIPKDKIVTFKNRMSKLTSLCFTNFENNGGSKAIVNELKNMYELLKEIGHQLKEFKLTNIFFSKNKPEQSLHFSSGDKIAGKLLDTIVKYLPNVEYLRIPVFPSDFKITFDQQEFLINKKIKKLTLDIHDVDSTFKNNFNNINMKKELNENEKEFEIFLDRVKVVEDRLKKFTIVLTTRVHCPTSTFKKMIGIKNIRMILYPHIVFFDPKPGENWNFGNTAFFKNLKAEDFALKKMKFIGRGYTDVIRFTLSESKISHIILSSIGDSEFLESFEELLPSLIVTKSVKKIEFRVVHEAFGFGHQAARNTPILSSHFVKLLTALLSFQNKSLKEILIGECSGVTYAPGGFGGVKFFHNKSQNIKPREEEIEKLLETIKNNVYIEKIQIHGSEVEKLTNEIASIIENRSKCSKEK